MRAVQIWHQHKQFWHLWTFSQSSWTKRWRSLSSLHCKHPNYCHLLQSAAFPCMAFHFSLCSHLLIPFISAPGLPTYITKVSTAFPNYFPFAFTSLHSSLPELFFFKNTACCLDQSFQSILNIRKKHWPFAVWTRWTVRRIVKTHQPSLLFNLLTPGIMKYWIGLR